MTAYNRHQHKRHGKHQKHTSKFLKVYTPYLPMLLIVTIGMVLSVLSPPKLHKDVLAYATSMSASELLAATNQDRAANGLPALKLNSKLGSAAQTKANDMVSRNYWSHETPDGQQPWVFITNTGYKYQAAGENLAYGFADSDKTVQGWMNSPEHKANMLNSSFVEVGFGFKNSSNFVGSGQETVVVAEYAKPVATTTAAAPASTTKPAATASAQSQSKPAAATTPAAEKAPTPTPQTNSTDQASPVATTAAAAVEPASQPVSRLSQVTGTNFGWMATATSIIIACGIITLLIRHAYGLNRWIKAGERYMLHHFAFDITIISLIGLCFIASQTIGFIK